jgi:DNA mismatch repair protein MutS
VVFLHSVKDGPASQSYGLQVAQLAGIPQAVIVAARQKLQQLEQQSVSAAVQPAGQVAGSRGKSARPIAPSPQPDLFATRSPSEVELHLRDVDPDGLTPRQAHELLYALKRLL